jgi:hypothetical protein
MPSCTYVHRDESYTVLVSSPGHSHVFNVTHRKGAAYGLQWVESIVLANKNIVFAMLVDLTKQFEAII